MFELQRNACLLFFKLAPIGPAGRAHHQQNYDVIKPVHAASRLAGEFDALLVSLFGTHGTRALHQQIYDVKKEHSRFKISGEKVHTREAGAFDTMIVSSHIDTKFDI